MRLHYLQWGEAGPPIGLLPGGCDTAHIFGDLGKALSQAARVFALTPRGCGQSGDSPEGYSLDQQLEELAGFLDAMRLGAVTTGGHSSGGSKAIRFARLHPERVTRLITFDITYTGAPPEFDALMSNAIQDSIGEIPMFRNRARRDVEAGRYFETTVTHPALMFFSRDLDEERIKQFSPAIQRSLTPLVAAIGQARRRQIDALRANGSNVTIVEQAATSHYPFVDRTMQVADLIKRFMGSSR